MKKTSLLFIVIVFISYSALAQISEGAVFLGGDFSASTAKQKSGNQSSSNKGITVSPVFGKATRENLVVGGSVSLGFDKSKTTSNLETIHNLYGAGLFVRKYNKLGARFYGFLQGGANILFEKYRYENNNVLDNKNRLTRISVSVSPGISYKLSKKLHLESGFREIVAIVYQHQKINNYGASTVTESTSNSFSVYSSLNNFSSNLYLGFRLLIDKK